LQTPDSSAAWLASYNFIYFSKPLFCLLHWQKNQEFFHHPSVSKTQTLTE